MYSKIALANYTIVFHFFRFRGSICVDNQKLFIIVLLSLSPGCPKRGQKPDGADLLFEVPRHELRSLIHVNYHSRL